MNSGRPASTDLTQHWEFLTANTSSGVTASASEMTSQAGTAPAAMRSSKHAYNQASEAASETNAPIASPNRTYIPSHNAADFPHSGTARHLTLLNSRSAVKKSDFPAGNARNLPREDQSHEERSILGIQPTP